MCDIIKAYFDKEIKETQDKKGILHLYRRDLGTLYSQIDKQRPEENVLYLLSSGR